MTLLVCVTQAKKLHTVATNTSSPDLSVAAGMVELGVTKTASTKKVHNFNFFNNHDTIIFIFS